MPGGPEPGTVRNAVSRFASLRERDDVSDVAKERWSLEKALVGRIGEVLVLPRKITQEQLRATLEIKKTDPRRLGEILLSQNLVSGEDLAQAVAEATGFEYVPLFEGSVDTAAVSLLGEKVLRK